MILYKAINGGGDITPMSRRSNNDFSPMSRPEGTVRKLQNNQQELSVYEENRNRNRTS